MYFQKKHHAPVGSRPGTLVIDAQARKPSVSVYNYSESGLEEYTVDNDEILSGKAEKLEAALKNESSTTWIDIQGLGDEELLRKFAEIFSLHPLTLADVVNVPQRPKVDFFENHVLIICAMIRIDEQRKNTSEQVSVIFGKGYVLTFQERAGDVFDPVRARIRKGNGLIRKRRSDYLAYALIDAVVDGYFPVLEAFGDHLEEMEEEVVQDPTEQTLQKIYAVRRELLNLRRLIWPKREALSSLLREDSDFIEDETRVFLRDTYEHAIQVIDFIETYRELASGFMDVYLSSISNRMNDIMKVLTIIGTIFIPLSFFAGVFGMNFEYIPGLKWHYGYYVFWAGNFIIAAGMCLFFRKQGWLGGKK